MLTPPKYRPFGLKEYTLHQAVLLSDMPNNTNTSDHTGGHPSCAVEGCACVAGLEHECGGGIGAPFIVIVLLLILASIVYFFFHFGWHEKACERMRDALRTPHQPGTREPAPGGAPAGRASTSAVAMNFTDDEAQDRVRTVMNQLGESEEGNTSKATLLKSCDWSSLTWTQRLEELEKAGLYMPPTAQQDSGC